MSFPRKTGALIAVACLFSVAFPSLEAGQSRDRGDPTQQPPRNLSSELSLMRQRAIAEMLPASDESVHIMDSAVTGYLPLLNQTSGLFADVAYQPVGTSDRSWWPVAVHLQRALLFGSAYLDNRSDHYQSIQLRNNMELALMTWIKNDVQGVEAFHNSNWWWEEIGLPRVIGKCLVLMTTWLEETDLDNWLDKATPILSRAYYTPLGKGTAANQVWRASSHALWALASNNASMMRMAYDVMQEAIIVQDGKNRADGIQVDYSFHQHGPLLYTGWGYGAIFTTTILDMDNMAYNTTFQMSDTLMDTFARFVLWGQLLTTRGANFDYTACGRLMTYFSSNDTFGLNSGHYHYFAAFTPYENAFPRFVPPFNTPLAVDFYHLLPMVTARDAKIRQHFKGFAERLAGNAKYDNVTAHKHFFSSDYSVHHRPGWAVTVRMYSTRTLNTECGNDEGKQGKTVADGVTNIYLNGSEYENTYPAWNWSLVPGTTEHQRGFPFSCGEATGVNHTEFVGGVSDGLVGMSAMNFSRSGISVHKAWFFADDFVVHMGSGAIDHAEHYTIATALDQKKLLSDVHVGQSTSEEMTNLTRGNHTLHNVTWLHHGRVLYLTSMNSSSESLPHGLDYEDTGATVGVFNMVRNGSWADITQGSNSTLNVDMFGAFIPNLPPNSVDMFKYAYTIAPNCDLLDVEARRNSVLAQILSTTNTRDMQSMCIATPALETRTLYAVFWKVPATTPKSPCWQLSSSSPVVVMVRQQVSEGVLNATFSIANPIAHNNRTVILTVHGAMLHGKGCEHDFVNVSSTITVDTSSDSTNTIGQTHQVTCQVVH